MKKQRRRRKTEACDERGMDKWKDKRKESLMDGRGMK